MFKKTLVAMAAAALAGTMGTSYAQVVEKTTVVYPVTADSKVVVKKQAVVRHPGATVVVHKKKIVHHPMTGQKVIHRSTVVKTPTSKTTIIKPTTVETEHKL